MSDYKTVKQLCEEHSNLDLHLHKLDNTITDLKKNNLDLRITITHLKNELDQNKKWTATVYDPNKSTYKELEDKLALAENSKQTAIDDLWETRIDPLRFELEDTNKKLDLLKIENSNLSTRIKQLNEVIKDLEVLINYAVGYISSCEQFRAKHPNDVKNWLFEGLK